MILDSWLLILRCDRQSTSCKLVLLDGFEAVAVEGAVGADEVGVEDEEVGAGGAGWVAELDDGGVAIGEGERGVELDGGFLIAERWGDDDDAGVDDAIAVSDGGFDLEFVMVMGFLFGWFFIFGRAFFHDLTRGGFFSASASDGIHSELFRVTFFNFFDSPCWSF